MPEVNNDTLNILLESLGPWAPWAAAFIIFCIWGMPHVVPIINAIGKIVNDRHKTNLLHQRSMQKLRNQVRGPANAPPSNGRTPRLPKTGGRKGKGD